MEKSLKNPAGDAIDVNGLFPGLTLTLADIFKLPELE
jgi:hypothetical protein